MNPNKADMNEMEQLRQTVDNLRGVLLRIEAKAEHANAFPQIRADKLAEIIQLCEEALDE
jgi:hypothetical protein